MGAANTCCVDENDEAIPVETAIASNADEKPTAASPAGPVIPVVITFRLEDGSTKEISFEEKPLGLDFGLRLPMSVKRIKDNSIGTEKGVGLGWTILQIDGEALPDNFDTTLKVVQKKLARLKDRS
eukprot:TRINITY_DN97103_c0_g1_i1.p1 TRINITY_DN97103_c0_g1~~TRINITY_DN97103_c0_g1_i1.p1  ORF type:complete len:126 (+),score=26.78 TRINITY_DN97103_c0_g1_i1:59-436(+)